MPNLTPLNDFPYPVENEDPFFTTYKSGEVARDVAHWATADNGNLVFSGGGTFSWNSGTGTLTWSSTVSISGFTTNFSATIASGSVVLQDGERAFFTMPRKPASAVAVTLTRGSRIYKAGTRLHDLRLFAARTGDVIYLLNGVSLKNGQSGALFGNGIIPTHNFQTQWLLDAGSVTSTLDLNSDSALTGKTLVAVDLYRNGLYQAQGGSYDYTVNLVTYAVTLISATIIGDRFVAIRRTSN